MSDVVPPQARLPGKAGLAPAAKLSERAYDCLERAIVSCDLAPGRFLSIPELQQLTGVGRTPTHLAVSQLAADTLLIIRPRHGLQIAPIDLVRERTLLELRGDLERFVARLACERASKAQRERLHGISVELRANRQLLSVDAFNLADLAIDRLTLAAAGEAFLGHTLRPLRSLSRRIGWIYHHHVPCGSRLDQTLDCHLSVVDALVGGHADAAVAAVGRLIAFCDSMFDILGKSVDPELFDCNLTERTMG